MAKYPSITLTNAGANMIAQSQGGTALIFTKIQLGDGAVATGADLKALTALINPLLTANINSIDTKTINGQATLETIISNTAVTTGFFGRELGVFAKVGESGTEQLYGYTNCGNYADYMPDSSTPLDANKIIITLVVGNAASVAAVINSSIVYVTLEQVEAEIKTHDSEEAAHAEAFAAHNNDTASHADIRALLKKAGAMPLGTILPFLMKSPPAGWLALDTGALVSRATYPELWTWVQANAPLISETDWQTQAAAQSSVGAYSTGDGSTTFRLPRIVDFVRGSDGTRTPGTWQADDLKSHSHVIKTWNGTTTTGGGVASASGGAGGIYDQPSTSISGVQPTGGSETRPKNVAMLYCVKAFDSAVNQGTADITAMANELLGKVDKTTYAADFAKSFGVNGYQKLPSGLIIQWGMQAYPGGSVLTTVTFPVVFPNACLNAMVTRNKGTTSTGAPAITSVTNSQLIFDSAKGSSNEPCFWFVIGY